MPHTCHAPGCDVVVPPKMHMCKPHWFSLPKHLRDRIWATYRPGQEIDKRPSAEYLAAFDETTKYMLLKSRIRASIASHGPEVAAEARRLGITPKGL